MPAFEENLWIVVRPAPDVPGQWVGHCLNFDIVSLGTSLENALHMTAEAVAICVADDLKQGVDPRLRPRAPKEDWELLKQVTEKGVYGTPPVGAKVLAATQFHLIVNRPDTGQMKVEPLPPAWMIEAMNRDSELRI